jgi:hypothetical protein
MDFVSWFFVESKVFEFLVPAWGSIFRLVERRKGISRVMMVGKYSVEWLKKVVEKMVFMVEDRAFSESSRDGNMAFAQKGVNLRKALIEPVASWSWWRVVKVSLLSQRVVIGGVGGFLPRNWERP